MKMIYNWLNNLDVKANTFWILLGFFLLALVLMFLTNWCITALIQYAAKTLWARDLNFWGVFCLVTGAQVFLQTIQNRVKRD